MKQGVEIILTMLATMLVALFFTAIAFARPPAGVTLDPQVHAWFESLQNPATGISCCGHSDGHVMDLKDVRNKGDGWQVRIDGAWVDVPAAAVLNRVDNPTGGFVTFWNRYAPGPAGVSIFCFVRPAMT